MTEHDIVAIGETMLRLTTSPDERLEDARSLAVHVAGSESNILSHVAQLGGRTLWLSALPDSPPGRLVAAELRRFGVGTQIRWGDSGSRVGTFYAEVTPEPAGPAVTYDRQNSAFATMSASDYDLAPIKRAKALLLTGITPALGPGPRKLVDAAISQAAEAGVPVVLDVNYRTRLWAASDAAPVLAVLARKASVVFCPAADAKALWDIDGSPSDMLPRLAERLGLAAGTRLVATLGAHGAAEWHDGVVTLAEAYPSAGSHRFGSGDAFAAGYIASWLGIATMATPLQLGCALAALKRCTPGDMAPLHTDDIARVFAAGRFR